MLINTVQEMLRDTLETWRADGRINGSGFDTLDFFSGGSSYSRIIEMTFREVATESPQLREAAVSLLSHISIHHELELAKITLYFLLQQQQQEEEEEEDRADGHGSYSSSVCAVTVATSFRPAMARLNASLAANGIELFVLGMGTKWKGHGMKLLFLERFLEAEKLRSHERFSHVLFLDAFDTLLLESSGSSAILTRFFTFGAGVVFNGETECTPDPHLQQAFLSQNRQHMPALPYLNSGVYMGDVEAVRLMLREVLVDMRTQFGLHDSDSMSKVDDQRLLMRWFLRQNNEIAKIDSSGYLFHTLHGFSSSDFVYSSELLGRGVVWSKVTQTSPLVLHGNGNGCVALLELAGHLKQLDWPPAQFRNKESAYPLELQTAKEWTENDARLQCTWPHNTYAT
jgi:hypothetical protein